MYPPSPKNTKIYITKYVLLKKSVLYKNSDNKYYENTLFSKFNDKPKNLDKFLAKSKKS